MEEDHRLIKDRKDKAAAIAGMGTEIYPYNFDKKDSAKELLSKHHGLTPETHAKDSVSIAGRIVSLRDMGKAAFFHLQDSSGKIQVYIRKDDIANYDVFKKVDMGDFVGIKGEIFATKTGEISIYAREFTFLTKAFRPFPEKYHGLKDIEQRYRKRYVDFVVNHDAKAVFEKRAKILRFIREFLDSEGFMEVQTPILQPLYGGGLARPFTTKINAWNMQMYLRIAYEIYLKKLIVGGFEKIYDLSYCFRNEGSDKTHNPEFTMMEIQWAYADYYNAMELTEKMWESIALKLNGTTKVKFGEKEIDFKAPWKRMTMAEAVKEFAGYDLEKMSDDEVKAALRTHKIECKDYSKGLALALLFEELCEQHLIQPTHIMDHPVEICPLAKPCRNDKRFAERVESFINCWEVGNYYSELTDPVLQRKNFEEQERAMKEGNDEAHPMDEDYIEALEYGLPPNCGIGVGVDRMIMLMTGQESIRDIILFPTMRPEVKEEEKKAKVSEDIANLPSREEALELLKKHVRDEYQLLHSRMVANILERYAEKLKQNKDLWYITGLLHDLDFFEHPEEHPFHELDFFKQQNFPEELIHAVAAHYFKKTTIMPETKLAKALLACDEIAGLIYAYAKMRPEGLIGMKASSFKKKFNEKSFAAKVDRDDISLGIEKLGIPFDEHVDFVIKVLSEMDELKK